jgi:diaminopimelate epimerase
MDTLHLPLPGDPAGVGMGNPHCVFFVPDADAVDPAARWGPRWNMTRCSRSAPMWNSSPHGPDRLRMRVWERGTGVTLACGSGACAVAVAAHLRGLTGRQVALRLDGGDLAVDWRDDGVWLTGPVAHVFTAELSPAFGVAVNAPHERPGLCHAGLPPERL